MWRVKFSISNPGSDLPNPDLDLPDPGLDLPDPDLDLPDPSSDLPDPDPTVAFTTTLDKKNWSKPQEKLDSLRQIDVE